MFDTFYGFNSAALWRIAMFYSRIFIYLFIFDFVYAINIKNKLWFFSAWWYASG
jgi:hypothetical protein